MNIRIECSSAWFLKYNTYISRRYLRMRLLNKERYTMYCNDHLNYFFWIFMSAETNIFSRYLRMRILEKESFEYSYSKMFSNITILFLISANVTTNIFFYISNDKIFKICKKSHKRMIIYIIRWFLTLENANMNIFRR